MRPLPRTDGRRLADAVWVSDLFVFAEERKDAAKTLGKYFLCFALMRRGKLLKAAPKARIRPAKQIQVCFHAAWCTEPSVCGMLGKQGVSYFPVLTKTLTLVSSVH